MDMSFLHLFGRNLMDDLSRILVFDHDGVMLIMRSICREGNICLYRSVLVLIRAGFYGDVLGRQYFMMRLRFCLCPDAGGHFTDGYTGIDAIHRRLQTIPVLTV